MSFRILPAFLNASSIYHTFACMRRVVQGKIMRIKRIWTIKVIKSQIMDY